ncbi:MAG: hypothetical protein U9Q99_01220 [Nanoarchaeota archaeon]|nr:hypothetical protein [Nanoarchaeota archaeon]
MKFNKILILILVSLFLVSFVSAEYIKSNPRYTSSVPYSSFDRGNSGSSFDKSMCEQGTDFIIQIAPFGCNPSVVRSDLLEEQDVYLFCELEALKINPLIDLSSINKITFSGDYPAEIKKIYFHPKYDSLGENSKLNNLMFDTIGHVVIQIRQNSNESSLMNCEKNSIGSEVCYLSGNLTAKLKYDFKNSFGLKRQTFYLPVMEDSEFDKRQGQYSFFDKRGYLRADYVGSNEASIGIYSGVYTNAFGFRGSRDKQKINNFNLKVGEESPKVFLPGFECLAGVKFRLDSLDIADTTVTLSINSQMIELTEGERFLEGRCEVVKNSIDKIGLNQKVKIRCNEDDKSFMKSSSYNLRISPKLLFNISNEKIEASVGDKLYDDGVKSVYLGYVVSEGDIYGSSSFRATFLTKPIKAGETSLSEDEIKFIACLREKEVSGIMRASCGTGSVFKWFVKGEWREDLVFNESKIVRGEIVSIIGFTGGQNIPLDKNSTLNYNKAIDSYDVVIDSFFDERYPETEEKTLAEISAYSKIELAISLKQENDVKDFCRDFKILFSDSKYDISECDNILHRSSSSPYDVNVLIDGDYKRIALEGVHEPNFKDYGVVLNVRRKDGTINEDYKLVKNSLIYVDVPKENSFDYDGKEFIRLEEIGEDFIKLKLDLKGSSIYTRIAKSGIVKEDIPEDFKSDYIFTVKEINYNRVAKVSINTFNDKQFSEVDFPFKVGIEKRAIQLSPEKISQRIEKLNKTIQTLEGITNVLGDTVKVMKAACLGTGATLTIKNIIQGSQGGTIARQEVMKGEGGWYEQCNDLIKKGNYSTEDQCYLQNADKIDAEVKNITKVLTVQNNKIKSIQNQKGISVTKFGQKFVDTEKLVEIYSKNVTKELAWLGDEIINPDKSTENINLTELKKVLTKDYWNENVYDLDNLKKIELYSILLEGDKNNEMYKKRLYTALNQVEVNSENSVKLFGLANKYGIDKHKIPFITLSEDTEVLPYYGYKLQDLGISIPGYDSISPVTTLQTSKGDQYIIVLKNQGTDIFPIENNSQGDLAVYDENLNLVEVKFGSKLDNIYFKLYDKSSYKNSYKNPELSFYETEPYKGLPAVIPIDIKDGWYVYIKQTLPGFGNMRAYDESGVVNSFWLCNVGSNGLEQSMKSPDDICQMINMGTGQPYNQFPYLEKEEAVALINKAVRAIKEASNIKRDGVKETNILGQRVSIGSPEVDSPGIACSDYMSPKDCQILFNVCDPVICPSSRCDFGGKYPVQDVIQSGVIGSVLLCAPNVKEGIYLPVCLTGINAGFEGYTSVVKSYQDCLKESLETGQTVGVCDKIHSIYTCEFFWRQAQPLAKIVAPNLLSKIFRQNTRGGGEYLGIQTAWENAKDSLDYFSQFYAVNSYKAFKARSTANVGGEVCGNFISQVYPNSGGVLDMLTEADSPIQFNANFEEILFTTATFPTTSHYKVFYHIYAGNDRGAYYQVYLRGSEGTSYFQDSNSGRIVNSGYIPRGEYASETMDFTAPSGYKELCVIVNNQEECGFKQVSTNFVSEYVKEKYVESQFTETDIKSEKECISGIPSVYSLANLNVQEGVGDLIDPAIYNRGIIRICATESPGSGQDLERWVEVGECDNPGIKCWLDKDSADDAFNPAWITKENALGDVTNEYVKSMLKSGKYLDEKEFDSKVEEILKEIDMIKRLGIINNISSKIYLNNHKGYLHLQTGKIYGIFAITSFNKMKKSFIGGSSTSTSSSSSSSGTLSNQINSIPISFTSSFFIFDFNKKDSDINSYVFQDGLWHYVSDPFTSSITYQNVYSQKLKDSFTNSYDSALTGKLLKTDEYEEGLDLFLEYLKQDGSEISIDKINYKDNLFTIKDVEKPFRNIYIKYEREWMYGYKILRFQKFKNIKWYSTSQIITPNWWINSPVNKLPENIVSLFKKLENETFEEGFKIIFSEEAILAFEAAKSSSSSSSNSGFGIITSNNLLDVLNYYEGRFVPVETCKLLSGQSFVHCTSSLQFIYNQIGVPKGIINNYFSVEDGTKFTTSDGTFIAGSNGDFKTYTGAYNVNINTEEKKLNLLEFGDRIDIIDGGHPHSMIFVEWINRVNNSAKMYDWNGNVFYLGNTNLLGEKCEVPYTYYSSSYGETICKTYRFVERDLSDDAFPIYRIKRPSSGIIIYNTVSSTISQKYINSYDKYKDNFKKYSVANLPKGFTEVEFRSLLVAISQQESGVGTSTTMGPNSDEPGIEWFMGYTDGANYPDNYRGVDNQIRLSSDTLERAFENNNKNYASCYTKTGEDKIICVLNQYYGGKNSYASNVLEFKESWEEYL